MLQGARKYHQFNRRRLILHSHISHHRIVARGFATHRRDNASQPHRHAVLVNRLGVFAGKIVDDLTDGRRIGAPRQRAVFVHRVAGQVQAGCLLFHRQQLAHRHLGDIRQGNLRILHALAAHTEQVHLPLDVALAALRDRVHHRARNSDELTATVSHGIECARFDQTFQRAAVEFAVIHALTEILERGKQAARLPLGYHCLHQRPPHALDCGQAKTNRTPGYRKAVERLIDIGRQYGNTHFARSLDIFRNFLRPVEHTGQQRGHIFARMMTLQVGRPERNNRIAHGMRLVKRIVCKVHDLVEQACRNFFRHAALDRAVDAQLLIAVDEVDALFFQLLHLLFAHRATHHIRLAERIAR